MSGKVLVVDDSGTMRKIIGRALNGAGFTDIVEAGGETSTTKRHPASEDARATPAVGAITG